jgi:hypothetical protein
MTCIRTGCLAYVAPYGEWVYGDAYEVDGALIIRCAGHDRDPSGFGSRRHFTVHDFEHWFDKDSTAISTLVAPERAYTSHGYEGEPIGESAS